MILDANLILSENQVVDTVGAHDSANVIDLDQVSDAFGNSIDPNPGESGNLWLNCLVTEDFAAGQDLAVKLRDSADNVSWGDTEINTGAVLLADLPKAGGALLRLGLPTGLKRYVKAVYTVGGATAMTSGKVSAFISDSTETPK